MKEIQKEIQIELFKKMLRVRLFEEKIVELYPEQEMRCPVHLSIGQEATAAGLCQALRKEDIIFGNHRSHGHFIAKGGSMKKMLAEIYGKATGCCKGVGGSMHLIDLEQGVIATTPIVGGTTPVAVGAALANQTQKNDIITTLFLGDGTVEEGVFHESINFACLKKLPIIFFCENNFFSVYTPLKYRQPLNRSVSQIASGHGVPTFNIDGNDVLEVYRTSSEAYERVRAGEGPVFIEATTYRWREHCGPNYDNHIGYRTEEEFLEWKARCPIDRMKKHFLTSQLLEERDFITISSEIQKEIDEAVKFAKESPFPDEERRFDYLYPSENLSKPLERRLNGSTSLSDPGKEKTL